MKPRLLDLFCGAGGAAMGYHRAGFEVWGVDNARQPNYPFPSFAILADAIGLLRDLLEGGPLPRIVSNGGGHAKWVGVPLTLEDFDAIHASPPCQPFTAYKRTGNVGEYPDLVAETSELLQRTALPYVIENVEGAPLENPTMLCGSAFGLDVRRHRLFETNFPLMAPGCVHGWQAPDRFPGGRSKQRTGTNRGLVRATVEVGTWDTPLDVQERAMGIDWMTLEELSEAIPPAYTEHVGGYLIRELEAKVAA